MQFNQITYFLRSCDTLNFTRAAEICHISQPSLSAAIHKLEDELGGSLFDRQGRELKLTPLGDSMRTHLNRIELARDAANFAASEFIRRSSSVINLGLMCTLNSRRLAYALATFGKEQFNCEVLVHDVSESKALELLLAGALDCLITARSADLPARFNEQWIADEAIVLAVNKSHPFANRRSVSFSELQGQAYVDRLRCEFREIYFTELMARDLSVNVVLRSEREDLVIESILASVGLSILPKNSAEEAGLKTCDIEGMSITRSVSMVTVKDRYLDTSVHEFIDHVVSSFDRPDTQLTSE